MSGELVPAQEVDAVPVQTEPPMAVGLFGSNDPVAVVGKATAVANALAAVLEAKKLYVNLKGRKHVLVEGWTLLGSMLGVFPVCVWTKKLDTGWEARVEARTLSGAVVGAAEAECLDSERNWRGKDDFSLRSMAQTRATGKAMRLPLGFVVSLAGYEATPAEEIMGMVVGDEAGVVVRGASTEAPAPPAIQSATGQSTEEHLAEAKKRREEALERFANLSGGGEAADREVRVSAPPSDQRARPTEIPAATTDEPIQEKLEKIKAEAAKKFGRPKSVPEFCPKCNTAVLQFEASGDGSKYWECHERNRERHLLKAQEADDATIRTATEGHYFKWHGKEAK